MNKHETKKEHILCSGIDVMKTRGYNGTSIKDIVDAAAVPKGSFYNYFESKEAFAIEALDYVFEKSRVKFESALLSEKTPAFKRLTNFFEFNAKDIEQNEYQVGCFIGNLCQEMADTNPAIREKVRYLFSQQTKVIALVIDQAIKQGDISADNQPIELAEFLFNAWEGALMRTKAAKCRSSLDAFLSILPRLKTL